MELRKLRKPALTRCRNCQKPFDRRIYKEDSKFWNLCDECREKAERNAKKVERDAKKVETPTLDVYMLREETAHEGW